MAGRNAAQLRAAATATGLFDGPKREYVGDGYSVPWEVSVGPLPIQWPNVYAFKLYLDTFYKEYSRLHDWLYTPYGKIINATQQESDDALQEELSHDDPVSAVVVGNACRYFGHLYFARSSVGYFGEQGTILGDNIGVTNPGTQLESHAVATKIVILFQQTTIKPISQPSINYVGKQRTGGWSESLYGPDSIADVIKLLTGPPPSGVLFPLLQARANILGSSASIIGARLYKGGAGKGQLLKVGFNGTNGVSDQPGTAVEISATSNTTGQSRRWITAGWADLDVKGGEWSPEGDTPTRVAQYFAALGNGGWLAQTNTNQVSLFSISSGGAVTTLSPHSFTVGSIVTIKNTTLDNANQRIGGRFVVSAIGPLGTNFTITGWNNSASSGGTASIVGNAFQAFSGCTLSVSKSTQRKIGRPFDSYRGKKSKRRKTA